MKRRNLFLLTCAFIGILLSNSRLAGGLGQASAQAEKGAGLALYVAVDGSDGNPGTQQKPLATPGRAQQLVRAMKTKGRVPITVWLRQGTYYLHKPLIFESADSGTPEAPITYAAYPGEQVTLSAGRRLYCRWAAYKDGIMMCALPQEKGARGPFTQLFVNGKRQIRARYPNYDPENPLVWGKGYINVAGAAESWPPIQFHFDPATFTKKR